MPESKQKPLGEAQSRVKFTAATFKITVDKSKEQLFPEATARSIKAAQLADEVDDLIKKAEEALVKQSSFQNQDRLPFPQTSKCWSRRRKYTVQITMWLPFPSVLNHHPDILDPTSTQSYTSVPSFDFPIHLRCHRLRDHRPGSGHAVVPGGALVVIIALPAAWARAEYYMNEKDLNSAARELNQLAGAAQGCLIGSRLPGDG